MATCFVQSVYLHVFFEAGKKFGVLTSAIRLGTVPSGVLMIPEPFYAVVLSGHEMSRSHSILCGRSKRA